MQSRLRLCNGIYTASNDIHDIDSITHNRAIIEEERESRTDLLRSEADVIFISASRAVINN